MVTVYAEESRLPSPVFPQGGPLTTEGTATGWVIDHREPLLCDDILSDQRFPITHKRYSEAGIRSYAILPLIAKGKILGALNLGSRRPRQYSQKEIAILTPLAEITSLAVENSNLYQESLRRAEIQGLLKELSQDIAFLDLDSLLKKLTEKVRQILHVDVSDLRVLEGSKWLPKGISGIDPRLISTEATGTTYGRSGWIIRQRRALAIPDITQDKGLPSGVTVRKLGLRGYLGVPLFSRDGEVIGILRALTYQPREFTQEDIDLLEQLANGAAIAIENARLFQEAKRKSQELAVLVEINRDVATLLDREILLPRIAEQVTRPLLPVYIQQTPNPAWTNLPYRSEPKLDLTEGSHFGYALQWFGFACLLALGYPLYVRNTQKLNKPATIAPSPSNI